MAKCSDILTGRIKDKLESELKEETDRNKDDIDHLELLQQHYKERCKAYDVRAHDQSRLQEYSSPLRTSKLPLERP